MSAALTAALWVVPLIIAWLWRPHTRPGAPGAMLLIAFSALGAWALWFGLYAHAGEPAGFFTWKPTVLYWTLATVAIVAPLAGWGYPVKIILGEYFALSNREWRWINGGFAVLYLGLGTVNLVVASEASYKDWVGFKYACLTNLLIVVLFRLNFVWLPILADVFIHLYRRVTGAWRYLASLF